MTTQRSARFPSRGALRWGVLALMGALGCQPENTAAMIPLPGGNMTPVPGTNMPGTSPIPTTGGGSGEAQLKFCNGIGSDKGAIDVEIAVGTLHVKVPSGTCTPAPGQACLLVPAGQSRISFSTGGKEVFAQDVALEPGQQYLVVSTVDKVSQKVGLGGGKLPAGAQCASADPFAGAGTAPGGMATAKFCHILGKSDNMGGQLPLQLELAIGDVHMTANSQGCSIPNGQPCQAVPAGATTASLYRDGQLVTSAPVTIEAGREYLFGLNLVEKRPVIAGAALSGAQSCSGVSARDTMALPALGPAPPPGPGAGTGIKLCNRLPAGVAEMMVGDALVLTAKPGECSTMKGTACQQVPSGPTAIVISIDGEQVLDTTETLPEGREEIFRLANNALNTDVLPAGTACKDFEPPP